MTDSWLWLLVTCLCAGFVVRAHAGVTLSVPGGVRVQDIDGSPSGTASTLNFSNGSVTINADGSATIVTGAGGGGDVSSDTVSTVIGQMVIFKSTAGKTIGQFTGNGMLKTVGNVVTVATPGTDYVVPAGNVATATALAADPADCSGGQAPIGINASGVAQGCVDIATQAELDAHAALTAPHSATDANTANRLVLRDASGNFAAGTITATLTGNASTASALNADPADCPAGQASTGINASGVAQGCFAPNIGNSSVFYQTDCTTPFPNTGNFCVDTDASPPTVYVGLDSATNSLVGPSNVAQGLEANRAVNRSFTGASSTSTAVEVCGSGTADCTGVAKTLLYAPAGNPEVACIAADGTDCPWNYKVPDGKARSKFIGNGVGGYTQCTDETADGIVSHLAAESCGAEVGKKYLEFAESDTDPTCAAGNYNLYADLSETALKVCNNGTKAPIATTNSTQTLTSKTLTTPVINAPATITSAPKVNTSPYTMTAADCGRLLWIQTGAGTVNLLADPTGGVTDGSCIVCLIEIDAVALLIDPNASDIIQTTSYNLESGSSLALSAGDRLQLAAVSGNSVCLAGYTSSVWVVLPGSLGTLSDAN